METLIKNTHFEETGGPDRCGPPVFVYAVTTMMFRGISATAGQLPTDDYQYTFTESYDSRSISATAGQLPIQGFDVERQIGLHHDVQRHHELHLVSGLLVNEFTDHAFHGIVSLLLRALAQYH